MLTCECGGVVELGKVANIPYAQCTECQTEWNDLGKRIEPTCDVCGTVDEESEEWCGSCGCCLEHCQNFQGCEEYWHFRHPVGPTRFATVKGFNSEREVKAYLPENYRLLGIYNDTAVIAGVDVAGWTLEGYVIPRLSSGNMGCRELVEAPF